MMLRSLLKREKEPPKQNKALKKLRNKVFLQAAIAVQTLIIAVALIFGMSAAWYNNVLQTSGLQFQAEAWGFSGQVTVMSPSALAAAPGDSGIVGIVIENPNEKMLDATVRVTKSQMPAQMQQRMFFYVDSTISRNGERMERVYVNAVSGYTYTVLENTNLVITEDRKNDSPLQWQWVYDMLGYYFLGTVDTQSTQVEEYLRPVEYNLDIATFDAEGNLETVDGVTTTEAFLENLSLTDGYTGEITPADGMPGYYRVDVDENGYGVWIYLCNLTDIRNATAYDTNLGLQAAAGNLENYSAVVSLVGQPTQITYTQVASVEELSTALSNGEMVQLSQDLLLSETLHIETQTKSILDLNEYTIQGPTADVALRLTEGSQLTILNGAIEGGNSGSDVVKIIGSELTLHNVTIAGEGKDGILVSDKDGQTDSTVRLFNTTIDVSRCTVFLHGNGTSTDGTTKLVIEDSTLTSDYIAVVGSGNDVSWGTDIQIHNSTVTGYYAAVYHPQSDGVITITESRLSGITGIAMKAGTLFLTDSQVYGTGTPEQIQAPSQTLSGFSDTGDAVYAEDGYGRHIQIFISGSQTVLHSDNGLALRVFEENSSYVDAVVTGGTFSSDVSAFVPDGYVYNGETKTVTKEGG